MHRTGYSNYQIEIMFMPRNNYEAVEKNYLRVTRKDTS